MLNALLALLLAGAGAVEERRPADKDATVEIESQAGSLQVLGWDKEEVLVTGSLGHGATGVRVTGGPARIRVSVESRGNPMGARADLEVKIPQGSRVKVESFGAEVAIRDVKGEVAAESVNGSIRIGGGPGLVEAETVNGSLDLEGPVHRARVHAVNGQVTVTGAVDELEAGTVNGRLLVTGGRSTRAELETVSGTLRFEGSLIGRATLDAHSVSGPVELLLPANVSAEFDVSTFSGLIENELGPAAAKKSKWTSEKGLEFSTGSGEAKVSIETLSGTISLRKK